MSKRRLAALLLVMSTSYASSTYGAGFEEMVKSGVLNLDKSATIGDVFDGYTYFGARSWKTTQDAQKRTIVEFRAVMDLDKYVGTDFNGVTLTPELIRKVNNPGFGLRINYVAQFAISKDQSGFQLRYSGLEMEGKNKNTGETKTTNQKDDDEFTFLKSVYNNEPSTATLAILVTIAGSVPDSVEEPQRKQEQPKAAEIANSVQQLSSVGTEIELLRGDVLVTAKVVEELNDDGTGYDFLIQVRGPHSKYELPTELIMVKDLQEAIFILKSSIKQIDNYLFIRTECGGGNAWRCNTESVFSRPNPELVYIGDVMSEDRNELGKYYSKGLFVTIYDKYEDNPLTSHGGAPGFKIYLRHVDGRLVPDLEHTWNESRKLESSVNLDQADIPTIREELLQKAVIAKYCRRPEELKEIVRNAKTRLPGEELSIFLGLVEGVVPGELPDAIANVVK